MISSHAKDAGEFSGKCFKNVLSKLVKSRSMWDASNSNHRIITGTHILPTQTLTNESQNIAGGNWKYLALTLFHM